MIKLLMCSLLFRAEAKSNDKMTSLGNRGLLVNTVGESYEYGCDI